MNMSKSSSKRRPSSQKVVARNKKAFHDYTVVKIYEAGIVLLGQEVKSVKAGQASLKESHIHVYNGEMWLWNCHIPQWQFSGDMNYDPTRKRKLLMHRSQIDSLMGQSRAKSMTILPLKMYLLRGRVKVEIGLCKGKKQYEKRAEARERTKKKEMHKLKREYIG